jgi:hypothetical protein
MHLSQMGYYSMVVVVVHQQSGLAWDPIRTAKVEEKDEMLRRHAHAIFLEGLERRGIVLRGRQVHLPDDLVGAYRFGTVSLVCVCVCVYMGVYGWLAVSLMVERV